MMLRNASWISCFYVLHFLQQLRHWCFCFFKVRRFLWQGDKIEMNEMTGREHNINTLLWKEKIKCLSSSQHSYYFMLTLFATKRTPSLNRWNGVILSHKQKQYVSFCKFIQHSSERWIKFAQIQLGLMHLTPISHIVTIFIYVHYNSD
jgi:hypothetical protein